MEQEAAYLAALVEAERFSVGGASLELLRSDGTNVAAFSRSNYRLQPTFEQSIIERSSLKA